MKGTDCSKQSQCAAILDWLKSGNTITPLEALDRFGCNRLAARINDLRRAGHNISSSLVAVFNRDGDKCRVAQYSILTAGGQDGEK